MKKLIVIFLIFVLNSCHHEPDQSARQINWDRDICATCLMGLADQKYSVQSINLREEVMWFDDLGCLVAIMATPDWEQFDGKHARIWIGDSETGEWIDAEKAWYTFGDHTPMGYGYSAHLQKVDSAFDYQTTMDRIRNGLTMREDFLKKKKMMHHEH